MGNVVCGDTTYETNVYDITQYSDYNNNNNNKHNSANDKYNTYTTQNNNNSKSSQLQSKHSMTTYHNNNNNSRLIRNSVISIKISNNDNDNDENVNKPNTDHNNNNNNNDHTTHPNMCKRKTPINNNNNNNNNAATTQIMRELSDSHTQELQHTGSMIDKPISDMSTLMMRATLDNANTGNDKQSLIKRKAMCRPADEILPFLYLGGYHNVWAEPNTLQRKTKYDQLMKMGITSILTAAEECECVWPKDFYYLKLPLFDTVKDNIAKYFQVCIDFIDRARYEDGKVIVHCWVGVSRSASICIAYLMARCDMRLYEAYNHVKQRRPIICPNKQFIKQLEQLDKDLYPDFITGQYDN